MTDAPRSPALADRLDAFHRAMRALQADPTAGGPPIGIAAWDTALVRLGEDLMTSCGAGDAVDIAPCRQVYLASCLYDVGGHTALIGDMVRALGTDAHVVITDFERDTPLPLAEAVRQRLALPAERIHVLAGPALPDRFAQALRVIRAARPRQLLFFHHPHDPIGALLSQPALAPVRVLVHHADRTPSFGMHAPGTRIVDLNPNAVAPTQLIGLASSLLRLTVPDPGPPPLARASDRPLVTVSSGSPHKFQSTYVFRFAPTIREVLRATGGRHVHIGPLPDEECAHIARVLVRGDVDPSRFVHVPKVPSLAGALHEMECDVFLASFPVSGARTRVEVLAAGVPYLAHAPHHAAIRGPWPDSGAAGLTWRTWDDLRVTLARLSQADLRAEHARRSRREYEDRHHPDAFATRLRAILQPDAPADPVDAANRTRARRWLIDGLRPLIDTIATLGPEAGPAALLTSARAELEALLLRLEEEETLAPRAGSAAPPRSLTARFIRRWR